MTSQAPVRTPKSKPSTDSNAEPVSAPPMKPRRGLFIALLCVFAVWVGILVWMYCATLKPHDPATRPAGPVVALWAQPGPAHPVG